MPRPPISDDLSGRGNSVLAVAFSPDGSMLASAGGNVRNTKDSDNTIRLWDVKTEKEIAQLEGHRGFVFSLAFSPALHIFDLLHIYAGDCTRIGRT